MGGMNNINPNPQLLVNDVPYGGPRNFAEAPVFLTPDALLMYCETRIRGLDEDIQKQFATQQNNLKDAASIDGFIQKLKNAYAATKDDKGNFKWNDMAAKLEEQNGFDPKDPHAWGDFIDSIQDPSAKAAVQKLCANWATTCQQHGNDTMSFQDLQDKVLGNLGDTKQSLSQGNELAMIQLQSIMSQRQTSIQLTTNLIQSLGDTLKTVAGNVGK
jgi:hypothetical protein